MNDLGYAAMWEKDHKLVTEWWARIQARPSFKMTYYNGARFSDAYGALMKETAAA